MADIAIDGLGRTGRATLKIIDELPGTEVVTVNWYDNERGFTGQMTRAAFSALSPPAPELSRIRP